MQTTYFLPDETGNTGRPDMIKVLGVLTFINTGLFILVYGIGLLGMMAVGRMPVEEFVTLVKDATTGYMPLDEGDRVEEMARLLHANGVSLMLIYLGRTVVRLFGAIGIWKGRRNGFYLYAAAQLLGLFLPLLVLPVSQLGFFGPLLTVGITALYGTQLKRLS